MAFEYDKEFYIQQSLDMLLKRLLSAIKNLDDKNIFQIRQAIEEKLKQGLPDEESKKAENLLYIIFRKYILLKYKNKQNSEEVV